MKGRNVHGYFCQSVLIQWKLGITIYIFNGLHVRNYCTLHNSFWCIIFIVAFAERILWVHLVIILNWFLLTVHVHFCVLHFTCKKSFQSKWFSLLHCFFRRSCWKQIVSAFRHHPKIDFFDSTFLLKAFSCVFCLYVF